MSDKLVSIVVPVYNGSYYINSCIKSLLGQSYKKIEILIINDGSTDKTKLKIKKFKDKRIKLINNKKNIGLARSLNKGFKLCKGEYIALNDVDDRSNKDRIEKQIKFLNKSKKIYLVASSIKLKKINCRTTIRIIENDPDIIKFYNIFDNYFTPSTFLFKSEVFKKYKIKFRKKLEPSQDFDFISQFYSKGLRIETIQEPLVTYTERSNSMSQRKNIKTFINSNIQIGQNNILRLFKKNNYRKEAIQIINIMNKVPINLNNIKLNKLINIIKICFYKVTKKKYEMKLYFFILKFIIFAYKDKYRKSFLIFKYCYKNYKKLFNFSKIFVHKYF